jgi:hypothetical protein
VALVEMERTDCLQQRGDCVMEKTVEAVKSLVVNQWKDGGMIRPYVEEQIFELFRLAYDRAK